MDTRAIPASLKTPAPAVTNRAFLSFKLFWFVLLLILLLAAGIRSLHYELRSYLFLTQFLDPHASGLFVRLEGHELVTQDVTLSTTDGPVRARLYAPRGVAHPEGMVLVHGIHHLGIDEPRLMNFARAAASNGFSVLTPEIAALADYHVDGASIGAIGESTAWLQQRLGTGPVTVVGVSFAGGLSLLAATDPRYAPHIRALVLMGAYDSLGRVVRFLATSQAEFPDGRMEPYAAHDYGAAVFVYSHLDHFFPTGDLAVAHDALRDWLWERPADAQALLPRLGPASRATMEILLARQIDRLRPKLLDAIQADDSQLSAISPEGKLAALHAPVFLLHGATDDIIPSTETLWLANEVPKPYLRAALITPAFSHVDPDKHALWTDQLRLVEFLAGVLRNAD
ncbi:MAG TPA: alpha/beta fold hydrolase [Candidatus Acidoferrales bacterium]|jgi:pimeloyl-ACP methyl ester carboxylesterase|nr:alpha/beta fold hydrolase [Candidatus Acidoferrales bacterium]